MGLIQVPHGTMVRRMALLVACLGLAGCAPWVLAPAHEDSVPVLLPYLGEAPPSAPREFRAAWVATVANIDWPSKSDLSVAQQQAEITAILDQAQALKLNAIVLQVRPSADALYPSSLEPWSEYLNAEQGKPPKPFYDPLALWIAQSHERGIELHAWINPYRARHSSAKSPAYATHISKTHPQVVKPYGESLWMDPAQPAAQQHTLNVVLDLVRRYDVDGIHVDDYFYPYPILAPSGPTSEQQSSVEVDFPDEPAWQAYLGGGGQRVRADWRRQQVNQLIETLYQRIHQEKPWVRFGISPFGLGRADRRAAGITGFSQYDGLYADVELWLANGWLDYLAPQLYWPIDQTPQAFATLLDSWAKENVHGRHLWPGLFTSRMDASQNPWPPEEIVNQISLTRQHPGASGHIHFSMVSLRQQRNGLSKLLQSGPYSWAALVPASPWLERDAPPAPHLALDPRPTPAALRIHPGTGKPAKLYAIWKRFGDSWRFFVQPGAQPRLSMEDDPELGPLNAVVVSAIDRVGNESPRASVQLTRAAK